MLESDLIVASIPSRSRPHSNANMASYHICIALRDGSSLPPSLHLSISPSFDLCSRTYEPWEFNRLRGELALEVHNGRAPLEFSPPAMLLANLGQKLYEPG